MQNLLFFSKIFTYNLTLLPVSLQIDFASRECHTDFLDKMEESGQLRASERPDESRVHKFRSQRGIENYQDDGYRRDGFVSCLFPVCCLSLL